MLEGLCGPFQLERTMFCNYCWVFKQAELEALGALSMCFRGSLKEPMEIEIMLMFGFFTHWKDPVEESSKL